MMNSKIKKLMLQHPTFNPEFSPAADLNNTLELLDTGGDFSPLGLEVVDVWKFDDEFGLAIEKPNVNVRIIGDPHDEFWKNNALIASRFGQGGVYYIQDFVI